TNTIVYIKPTSRVHTLKSWQQAHNIGHAVWGYAKEKGSRIYADFNKALRKIVYDMQQKADEKTGGEKEAMPNARESTLMLGRVLGTGASFRRMFSAGVDDKGGNEFDKPSFRVNTALNSYDEAMFDLIAVFLNSGGKIPIKTGGDIKGTPISD